MQRASRIGSLPLTEYNPDNSLKAEPYIFYIQSDKIFAYSTVECKAQAVIDLRKSFNISIVSYQKFDSRPKGVTEPAKTYRFMVLCTLGTGEEICALLSYDVVEGKLSEPIKQTAACDACFLGTESEQNPAVVLLGISRQHVTISTFAKSEHKYAEAPADKIELRGKARSLYRTPLNSGITVVYQSYGEHALKFSQNRAEGASKWNLAFLNDSNISMRLKYDEIAFDVVWQNEALCAVTTNQRVIIANNKLKILYEYNLANLELSSTVTSSWWLGNSLLFTNYTHLFYVVPEHPFVPHAVMSLPESRILVGSLLDRVFTFREDVGGAAIKILPVVLNEPLIVGYLASLGKKIEKEKVAELVVKLNGGLISNNLIKALNTVGMSYSAMDLVSKPSNPQFTEKDKVEQAVRQKDSSKAIELITGIKEINNPPEHAVTESMLRARSDPTYKFEKHQLKQTLQAALIMGQYKIAYLCAELLNDQKTGYRVLSGYNAASKLVKSLKPESKVAEQVMATDLECSINAVEGTKKKIRHEENTLRNWKVEPATINEVIKRPRTTHHGVLGIKMEDKKILYFTQYISQDRSVESKDLPAIRDASLGEWLGYDLVVSSLSLPEKIPDQYIFVLKAQNRIFQEQQSSEVPLLPEDTTADNFAESDYLLCYYRLDEGPRSKELIDASDKKINASLIAPESAYETIWGEELGLGEPLDYEDRWGVKAMPNRSLRVNSENTYIKIKATEKTAIMKSTFTLEMWTKFDDLEKKNCILQSSKNSLNVAVARETITVTNGKKQINISLDKAIIEKAWTHLAIVWHCNAPVPIQVLVDGKIAGNTKEKLSNQNWAKEDLILCKFEGEVTEIRIWGTNLNEKIIAGNKKVPLSILSNRQSMIQLTIKRQAKEPAVEKKKTGILAPHKKSALAPPPKGGLKKPGLKKPPSKEPVVKPAEKEEEKVTSSQRSSNVGKSFELSESSGSPSIWSSSSGGKDKLERTSIEKANPHVETRSEPTSTSTKVSILSDVVNHITTGNLAATMTTIEEHLKRFAAKPMLDASDKKVFAQLSRYKFIVKALSVIHQLRLNEDQASIQQSADLANVVVVIKTSRKVKPNLYKLAVFLLTLNTILPQLSKNMKAKNYASAMKLISHALTDNTLTESERKTLTDTLEVILVQNINVQECKKQGGVDTFPLNVVCPNCDSRLPYGTATPICKSCNQQLLFCFHVRLQFVSENYRA
eukprot:TRINITY_DN1293_c0_g1_i1.p1 TRINITY_DN1293_c0_g1~~TRINITY_DN1293_c0_g1_i1.p1  ORF type:complete len:1221 (+),score=110.00 TRINITY_DN1293_c0_g1_i1:10109-13771(+)